MNQTFYPNTYIKRFVHWKFKETNNSSKTNDKKNNNFRIQIIKVSPESVADLVDLEQELSSIQRGITQMERITPIEPPTKNQSEDDPFGDSFTQYPVRKCSMHSITFGQLI